MGFLAFDFCIIIPVNEKVIRDIKNTIIKQNLVQEAVKCNFLRYALLSIIV